MSQPYTILKNADPGVNLPIAVLLAKASQAAYGEAATPDAWAKSAGIPGATLFDRSNVQGFWCVHDGVGVLAFRGTSNIGQWIRDARFFPAEFPWGRLHIGFRDGVGAVMPDLEAFAKAAAGANYVWVTGHSLGGALAVIAAARLKMLASKPISAQVYTYGQPRVGLEGFVGRFDKELPGRLVRFINQQDIVPRVPTDPFYHHGGLGKRIVSPGVLATARAVAPFVPADERGVALMRALEGAAESAAAAEATLARGMAHPAPQSTHLADGDLPSLTPEQFAELQFGLGADPVETAGHATPRSGEAPAARAITIPAIADHAIAEYIRLLDEIAKKG